MMKNFSRMISFIKKTYRTLNMRKRVILLYVLVVLLPVSVLMYAFYQRSAAIIEREVTKTSLQALKQTEINISYRLQNVMDISNNLVMNPDIYKLLLVDAEKNSLDREVRDTEELRKIVDGIQKNKDIFRVRLFANNNKIYTHERFNFFPMEEIQKKDWYPKVVDNNGKVYWQSTYPESYIDGREVYVAPCARLIRHPDHYGTFIGLLLLDLSEASLYEILSNIDLERKENIYIINREGVIVSHYDKSRIGTVMDGYGKLAASITAAEGIVESEQGGGKSYTVFCEIKATGWKIVAEIPSNQITQKIMEFDIFSFLITVFLTFGAFLLILFLISLIFTQGIDRKTKELVASMGDIGLEGWNDKTAESGNMSLLEQSVNSLIHSVKKLMNEIYTEKLHAKEVELRLLQAQINPHFLYNAIDTIYWMAMRRNAQDIGEMLSSLAKYFRLSLNKGKDIVEVHDEIELTRAYINIQKARFAGKFSAVYQIDEAVGSYLMPKLTLQPIVENALLHGILKMDGTKGQLSISVVKEEAGLHFCIRDNGIGMGEDAANRILASGREGEPNTGYGLHNVDMRIKLFSGETSGLHISSAPGKGTCVQFILKAVTEEEG